MRRLAFTQELHGKLTVVGPGLLDACLAACGGSAEEGRFQLDGAARPDH